MATKKELEERIKQLENELSFVQGMCNNLSKKIALIENQQEKAQNSVYFKVEPHYLQVGDQWRDEEGDEYVLARITKTLNRNNMLALINVSKGKIHCNEVMETELGKTTNTEVHRHELGITESMTKIK